MIFQEISLWMTFCGGKGSLYGLFGLHKFLFFQLLQLQLHRQTCQRMHQRTYQPIHQRTHQVISTLYEVHTVLILSYVQIMWIWQCFNRDSCHNIYCLIFISFKYLSATQIVLGEGDIVLLLPFIHPSICPCVAI